MNKAKLRSKPSSSIQTKRIRREQSMTAERIMYLVQGLQPSYSKYTRKLIFETNSWEGQMIRRYSPNIFLRNFKFKLPKFLSTLVIYCRETGNDNLIKIWSMMRNLKIKNLTIHYLKPEAVNFQVIKRFRIEHLSLYGIGVENPKLLEFLKRSTKTQFFKVFFNPTNYKIDNQHTVAKLILILNSWKHLKWISLYKGSYAWLNNTYLSIELRQKLRLLPIKALDSSYFSESIIRLPDCLESLRFDLAERNFLQVSQFCSSFNEGKFCKSTDLKRISGSLICLECEAFLTWLLKNQKLKNIEFDFFYRRLDPTSILGIWNLFLVSFRDVEYLTLKIKVPSILDLENDQKLVEFSRNVKILKNLKQLNIDFSDIALGNSSFDEFSNSILTLNNLKKFKICSNKEQNFGRKSFYKFSDAILQLSHLIELEINLNVQKLWNEVLIFCQNILNRKKRKKMTNLWLNFQYQTSSLWSNLRIDTLKSDFQVYGAYLEVKSFSMPKGIAYTLPFLIIGTIISILFIIIYRNRNSDFL